MIERSEVTDEHPAVEDMVGYVCGSLDRARHAHVERHLALCRPCANEVGDLVLLTRRKASWSRRLPWAAAAAGLAAGLALMVSIPSRPPPDHTRHRAPEQTSPALLEAISPRGPATQPVTLIWSRLRNSGAYRVTVFDAEGTILYRQEVNDSVLTLPDSIHYAPSESYFWKVESDTGWNRWVSSRLVEFSLPPDSLRRP